MEEKTEVRIVDYVDRRVPMLERMFEKPLPIHHHLHRALRHRRNVAETSVLHPDSEVNFGYGAALNRFRERRCGILAIRPRTSASDDRSASSLGARSASTSAGKRVREGCVTFGKPDCVARAFCPYQAL